MNNRKVTKVIVGYKPFDAVDLIQKAGSLCFSRLDSQRISSHWEQRRSIRSGLNIKSAVG